jgi:pSer/pThr/pTyr-binding forkhead associated (FHA) protein
MERPEDRVALIEWLDRDGHVQRHMDVAAWPLSLGRALSNTVVLDDPYVAAHHARVAPDDNGQLQLLALPSRNGVLLDGRALSAGAAPLPAGTAVLQLGTTRLRLRLADGAVEADQPLPAHTGAGLRTTALAALALMVLVMAEVWVGLDPGADYTAWLPLLLGMPVAVALWCGMWALLSKLFQHRFDFSGHLRIALPWLLGMTLLDQLWPQLMAALAWPRLWMASGLLENLLMVLLLHAHLRHTLPQHRRAVTAVVAVLAVAGAGFSTALTWRAHDSLVATPYMSTLPPPALRLGATAPSAELVRDMAPLAALLAERVAQARKDEEAGEAAGGDGEIDE